MKKTTSITMLALLSFLVLITNTKADAVLTSSGEEVVPGQSYYIISSIRGAGGGGILATPSIKDGPDTSCIFNVVQSPLDAVRGIPVTFGYVGGVGPFPVEEDTPGLTISFPRLGTCRRTPFTWVLRPTGNEQTPDLLTTVGFDPAPTGRWFRIVRAPGLSGNNYQLRHCFSCPRCLPATPDLCTNLGIVNVDGERRLGPTGGRPFIFHLIKADRENGIKTVV